MGEERLELSQIALLAPKTSASTISPLARRQQCLHSTGGIAIQQVNRMELAGNTHEKTLLRMIGRAGMSFALKMTR